MINNIVAIDGAYKVAPNFSVGVMYNKEYKSTVERDSTSQRGELHGLLLALREARDTAKPMIVISDSSYIVNSMNKEWYLNWERKGWVTAANEPVKNQDVWKEVIHLMSEIDDIQFYHVPGHVLSIGQVAARVFIEEGRLELMYNIFATKFDNPTPRVFEKIVKAKQEFNYINAIDCPDDAFRTMILYNSMADTLASYVKERSIAEWTKST
jgi:ribonuclease HI